MTQSDEYQIIFRKAVWDMGEKPSDLGRAMSNVADTREFPLKVPPLTWLEEHLRGAGPNDPIHHALGMALRVWDRAGDDTEWTKKTSHNNKERRELIYERLHLSTALRLRCNESLPPFTESETPVIIADEHEPWYTEHRRQVRHYWDNYCRYLMEFGNWDGDAVSKLDEATNDVISRVSDPTRREAYKTKGLVIGHVQSGKTANFTGVLAKAADAGYRLLIVLAGTMDILRDQTQRRIDKELLGKEMVGSDYINDPDWLAFNSHGEAPREFEWERLTGPAEDYRALKRGIAALEFRAKVAGKPYFAPENLHPSPARLLVIKKIPRVLEKLTADLKQIRTRLADVPALVIDDESDQASINTVKPDKAAENIRTSTNREITHLLNILPRAQYIGYTATPYANVFISPDDAEDLFPKDFILSLPRPEGYMGVSDFYDFDGKPEGYLSNEDAFVRSVRGDDSEENNLPNAIDCFVLAGAIKLFRQAKDPKRYNFLHHTMLVHHSPFRKVHAVQAEKIQVEFDNAGYWAGKGPGRLRKLFENEFLKVTQAQGPSEVMPANFNEIGPFVATCLTKLMQDKTVLIVNGEYKDDTPDFNRGPIWAILVGGAKLSRGYTVEGLTTTYFRRVASASDTLMQMGRWFGFRQGYHDLVRLFIGKDEPIGPKAKRKLDLYDAFRGMCLDDAEFRRDIAKYSKERIKPIQVPPLVPAHVAALSPTAKNKMYNATIIFRNFGGETSQRTLATTVKAEAAANAVAAIKLLMTATLSSQEVVFIDRNINKKTRTQRTSPVKFHAVTGCVEPQAMIDFLNTYCWERNAKLLHHEIKFLEGQKGNPEINDWLIMAPTLETRPACWPEKKVPGMTQFTVKERARVGNRFNVYSEPDHMLAARYIAGLTDEVDGPGQWLEQARKSHRGVMLFYPVKEKGEGDKFVTIGFALVFPQNKLSKKIEWTVWDKNHSDDVVIDRSSVVSLHNPKGGRDKRKK